MVFAYFHLILFVVLVILKIKFGDFNVYKFVFIAFALFNVIIILSALIKKNPSD